MITKNYTHDLGQFEVYLHGLKGLGLRGKIEVRGIPYSVSTNYEINGDKVNESYRFVARTDDFRKEATLKQKDVVTDLMKGVAIDFYCAYKELFERAEAQRIADRLKALQNEAIELEKALNTKRDEIARYRLDNNLF